eukprot:334001-Chlamydomonas_euryale.AAC.5
MKPCSLPSFQRFQIQRLTCAPTFRCAASTAAWRSTSFAALAMSGWSAGRSHESTASLAPPPPPEPPRFADAAPRNARLAIMRAFSMHHGVQHARSARVSKQHGCNAAFMRQGQHPACTHVAPVSIAQQSGSA